jgi:hypothetical protein
MHSIARRWFLILLCAFGLGGAESIAQSTPPPAPPPPEAGQFNFWIGEWDVTTPDGKPAGSSHIQSVAGGRALLENWEGAGGSSGKSLNSYNAAKKQWQQFWVDNSGGVLELAGGLVDGRMVLANSAKRRDGTTLLNRLTWTPNADGSVRQLWEQSTDDGKTWQAAFDGLYRHRAKQP